MTNTEIIEIIEKTINETMSAKIYEENLYLAGCKEGLKMALKIIRDHDSAILDAMANYYEGV